MNNNTTDFTIDKVTYTFKQEIGWAEQASYDATSHMMVRMPNERLALSERAFSKIDMQGTMLAIPDPVQQRLAKLKAWLVEWTGVRSPKEKDFLAISPRHMEAIESWILELEDKMSGKEIPDFLETPSTD